MKKSSTKAEGMRDVSLIILQRDIFFRKPSLKRTFGWDFTALEIFKAVAAEGSVTRAAENNWAAQSNVTTRFSSWKSSWARRCSCAKGRRPGAHTGRANPCAAGRPPAGPGRRGPQAVPAAAGWAPAPGRHGKHSCCAPAPSRWRNCMPSGPTWCWTCPPDPPDNWWNKSPPTRWMPPWSPGHHRAGNRYAGWERTRCFRIAAAGPARTPPTGAKPADLQLHTLAAFTRLHLPPLSAKHGCKAPAAQSAPSAGAGVVPRHHRLRGGGRCAGGSPGRMGLDARAPGPAPRAPCRPATRCWCAGAATSRPRWMRCWPHCKAHNSPLPAWISSP